MDRLILLVNMVQNYLEELRRQVDELEKLLINIEFVNKVVNVLQRYLDIVEVLKDVLVIV